MAVGVPVTRQITNLSTRNVAERAGRCPERDQQLRLKHQLRPCSRLDRSLSRGLRSRRCELPGHLRQRPRPERVPDRRHQPVLEERMHSGRLWR